MTKRTVEDLDVAGKRVFVRVDFNAPMKNGIITDDSKIRAALPTLRYLIDHGAKVLVASHLGRPKGEVVETLRTTPVAEPRSGVPVMSQWLGRVAGSRRATATDAGRRGAGGTGGEAAVPLRVIDPA